MQPDDQNQFWLASPTIPWVTVALFGLEFAVGPHRLPANVTGLQVMPEKDPRFAQLPAEVNLAAVEQGGKIDQAFRAALGLDAQRPQFLDILAEAQGVLLHVLLDLDEFFLIGIA